MRRVKRGTLRQTYGAWLCWIRAVAGLGDPEIPPVASAWLDSEAVVGETYVMEMLFLLQDEAPPTDPAFVYGPLAAASTVTASAMPGTVDHCLVVFTTPSCTADPEVCDDYLLCTTDTCDAESGRFKLPLGELEALCRLAYFEELRTRSGLTQAEVARVFGRSLRSVTALEREFRSDFLEPAAEVELGRRLEEWLAEGEQAIDELADRDPELEVATLQRHLDALVGGARARRVEGPPPKYVLAERYLSLVEEDLHARLGGLRHQLEVISEAARRRFLTKDNGRPAVARTISFAGRAEQVEAAAKEIVRRVRELAIEVEEEALDTGGYDRYAITLAISAVDDEK